MKASPALRDNFYVDTAYRIVHEDRDVVIVDKPAPLAVHAVGAYRELNLQTLMQNDPRFAGTPVKTVHRLDSETSGVLVIAKTDSAASFLGHEFMAGRVTKKYEAIVFGRPAAAEGEIDTPLGYDASSGFQTVRVADPSGETARTRYRVLSSTADYARVELEPLTGRTHQLRAHLAILGHPIVGDKIYVDLGLFERYVAGGVDDEILARLKLPRLALHASRIEFTHPATRAACRFDAPLAPLLAEFARAQGLTADR